MLVPCVQVLAQQFKCLLPASGSVELTRVHKLSKAMGNCADCFYI